MKLNEKRTGEIFVFIETTLWALFPLISSVLIKGIPPIFSLSLSTFAAAIFFGLIITIKKEWSQNPSKTCWKNTIIGSLIIGVVFYSLIFIGLKHTSPGNAALISNMEVFFGMVILGPLLKHETITKQIFYAAILMVFGSILIIFPGKITPNPGDLIILMAVALVPLGNLFQQKARKEASTNFIMFWRSLISALFTLILALAIESNITLSIEPKYWILIIINGFFLLGFSKFLWIEGLHRLTISHANVIGSLYPAITLIFGYLIFNESPTLWQIGGFIPMMIGIQILLNKKTKLTVKS